MTTPTATAPAADLAPTRTSLRKALALVAVLATLLVGFVVSQSSPASAATAVTGCFTSGGGTYASQPVNLMGWNGSRWVVLRNGRTGASGCGTFTNVPSGYYVSMQAYRVIGDGQIGQAIFQSRITTWATPGTGGVNIGRADVPLVQCTQGLYAYCAGH